MSSLAPTDLGAVAFELDERGVVWITLNRPNAANARNQRMRDELSALYESISRAEDVNVVVLTGAGDRFFCAGMDLKEAGRPESPLERRTRLRGSRDIEQLARLPQPTIAAVNGFALGGGCEMALACDLRVVATEAKIGMPEVTHGLTPGGGGTQRLPRLIGYARAAELILLGRPLTGPEAVEYGLANMHVPREELRPVVSELAGAIAAHPAEGVRAAKEALLAGLELPLSAGIDRELDGLLFVLAERDRSRSVAAGNGSATPAGDSTAHSA